MRIYRNLFQFIAFCRDEKNAAHAINSENYVFLTAFCHNKAFSDVCVRLLWFASSGFDEKWRPDTKLWIISFWFAWFILTKVLHFFFHEKQSTKGLFIHPLLFYINFFHMVTGIIKSSCNGKEDNQLFFFLSMEIWFIKNDVINAFGAQIWRVFNRWTRFQCSASIC